MSMQWLCTSAMCIQMITIYMSTKCQSCVCFVLKDTMQRGILTCFLCVWWAAVKALRVLIINAKSNKLYSLIIIIGDRRFMQWSQMIWVFRYLFCTFGYRFYVIQWVSFENLLRTITVSLWVSTVLRTSHRSRQHFDATWFIARTRILHILLAYLSIPYPQTRLCQAKKKKWSTGRNRSARCHAQSVYYVARIPYFSPTAIKLHPYISLWYRISFYIHINITCHFPFKSHSTFTFLSFIEII